MGSRVSVNPDAWQRLSGARALLPAVARGDARGRAGRVAASPAGLARRGCRGRRRLPARPGSPPRPSKARPWTRSVPPDRPRRCRPRRLLRGRRRGRRSGLRRGRRRGPADRADVRSGGARRLFRDMTLLVRGGGHPARCVGGGDARRPPHDSGGVHQGLASRAASSGGALGSWLVRRTLVVTNDFPPRPGGIQTFVHELVRQLPPDSVVVYASRGRGRGVRRLAAVSGSSGTAAACCCRARRWPGGPRHSCATHECDRVLFGAAAPLGLLAPTACERQGPAASSG